MTNISDKVDLTVMSDIMVEMGIYDLPRDTLKFIFMSVPFDIKIEALRCGIDTVVRDEIFDFLNYEPPEPFCYGEDPYGNRQSIAYLNPMYINYLMYVHPDYNEAMMLKRIMMEHKGKFNPRMVYKYFNEFKNGKKEKVE